MYPGHQKFLLSEYQALWADAGVEMPDGWDRALLRRLPGDVPEADLPFEGGAMHHGSTAAPAPCNFCGPLPERVPQPPSGEAREGLALVGACSEGEPFAGASGALLDKILAAMELDRSRVLLVEVGKCTPHGSTCRETLADELGRSGCRVVVALGSVAASAVLGNTVSVADVRGAFHESPLGRGFRVMPTFAPAELLSHPELKRNVWEDMKAVMARLGK